jgi:protocatechuate 3,4-dioxygenase beta subunit
VPNPWARMTPHGGAPAQRLPASTRLAGRILQPERTGCVEQLCPALIVGQVVDAESGKPVSGATVAINAARAPRGEASSERWVPTRLTGADGYFVYRNLRAGSYDLQAQKPGYASGGVGRKRPNGPTQPITLKQGERVGDVVLRVWKQGAIGGTVIDEAGEPVVGIQLRCWRRQPSTERWTACGQAAYTDDRGMYRLSGLLPGEHVIGAANRPVATSTIVDGMARVSELWFPIGNARRAPAVPSRQPGVPLLVYPQTFHPAARSAGSAAVVAIGSSEDRSGIDLQLHAVPTARVSGNVVAPVDAPRAVTIRLVPALPDDITLEQDAPLTAASSDGTFAFPSVD